MQNRSRDQSDIKVNNMKLVLDALRLYRPISRAEIAKKLQISPPSVTRIIMLLQNMGLVRETKEIGGKVGRKAVLLDLVNDSVYAVGVEIDSKFLKVCIGDFCYQMLGLEQEWFETFPSNPDEVAARAHALYRLLLEKLGLSATKVIGVGVSIGGTVDPVTGTVVLSPQTKWENLPLAKIFENKFGLPTLVENDVKAELMGEKIFISAEESDNLVVLHIGSGMGAAAASHGTIVRGKQNAAGEIGHIIVDATNKIRCDCGRVGCLQTYVAERFVVRNALQFSETITGYADLAEAYKSGESWAVDLLDDIAKYIEIALNILINMYNPSAIVASGPFFRYFGELVSSMEARLNRMAFKPLHASCAILLSSSRGQGSVLGACILACEDCLEERFITATLEDRSEC